MRDSLVEFIDLPPLSRQLAAARSAVSADRSKELGEDDAAYDAWLALGDSTDGGLESMVVDASLVTKASSGAPRRPEQHAVLGRRGPSPGSSKSSRMSDLR